MFHTIEPIPIPLYTFRPLIADLVGFHPRGFAPCDNLHSVSVLMKQNKRARDNVIIANAVSMVNSNFRSFNRHPAISHITESFSYQIPTTRKAAPTCTEPSSQIPAHPELVHVSFPSQSMQHFCLHFCGYSALHNSHISSLLMPLYTLRNLLLYDLHAVQRRFKSHERAKCSYQFTLPFCHHRPNSKFQTLRLLVDTSHQNPSFIYDSLRCFSPEFLPFCHQPLCRQSFVHTFPVKLRTEGIKNALRGRWSEKF